MYKHIYIYIYIETYTPNMPRIEANNINSGKNQ